MIPAVNAPLQVASLMLMRKGLVVAASLLALAASPPAADAHPGIGIVADKAGNIFYTDLHQVLMIDTGGRVSVVVPRVHTHELYIDADGNLFGEHLWYEGDQTGQWGHRVWKRSPDGTIADVVPARRGFRTTFEFVRDAGGNQYWVGDSTGDAAKTRTTLFARAPSGERRVVARGLVDARWIGVANDAIYVVDDRRIKLVTRDGAMKIVSPPLASGLMADFIGGAAFDRHGNIYVANYGAARVDRIQPDGRLTVFARSGLRYGPTGILITEDDVWVLEYATINAVRVRRFTRDGRVRGVYSR